jgi:hypothetical protein
MGRFLDGYAMVLDSAGERSAEVARRTIEAVYAAPRAAMKIAGIEAVLRGQLSPFSLASHRIVERVSEQRGIPEE